MAGVILYRYDQEEVKEIFFLRLTGLPNIMQHFIYRLV